MSDEGEGSNVINSTDAKRWVGEVERIDKEILSIKMTNAAQVKAAKERRSECLDRADAAGVPKDALELELKRRALDRERKNLELGAGFDQVELADMIREVLGDFAALPLGQAAVKAASPEKKKGRSKKAAVALVGEDKGAKPKTGADGEPDVRSTRQKDKEALRKADAEERLKGIKPLDGDDAGAVH